MPKYKILQEGASYTFRSYCEMNAEPEDILSDLGYQLLTARLVLPKTATVLSWEGGVAGAVGAIVDGGDADK